MIILILTSWSAALPAGGLQTSFDNQGLASLSYNGVSLIDLKAGRGDRFAVGGYKLGSRSGWGATGNQTNWNASEQKLTWAWDWGRVDCRFASAEHKDALDLQLTVSNDSKEQLESLDIFPLGLQFPALPKDFGAPNYPQFKNGLDGPAIIQADYGSGAMIIAGVDTKPLYVGLSPSGAANHYQLHVGTTNEESEGFLARAVPVHRPVPPGHTDSYTVSLRFFPSGYDLKAAVLDVLRAYGRAWPQALHWEDRRPIGELFLSVATQSPRAGTLPNPRNYIVAKNIDVQSKEGLAAFKQAVLSYADNTVARLKRMNAQGVIVWDLEGQQFPQPDTSYAGDPQNLPKLSPEMDAVADEFFKKFKDADLRCGLTLRPQKLDFSSPTPSQKEVPTRLQADVLVEKASYAFKRWGCTMFYVDSDGGPLDASPPSVFEEALRKMPQALFIPENIWPKDYASTAPLASFTAPYKPLHTPSLIKAIWPGAFSVTYVGDVPGSDLKKNGKQWAEFVDAVREGDVLSFRAWYDDEPLNGQIREIYREAGAKPQKTAAAK